MEIWYAHKEVGGYGCHNQRREVKGKGERERYSQLNAEFQRIARRDKTAFLNETMQTNRRKQ